MQPLAVITCKQELSGSEKVANLIVFRVVANLLANAVFHAHSRFLQLNDANGNAVNVYHHVGTASVILADVSAHGYFLGYCEIVCAYVLPVNQMNCF